MLRNLDFIFWGVSGFWKEVHEGDRNKSNIVLRNVESGCGVWVWCVDGVGKSLHHFWGLWLWAAVRLLSWLGFLLCNIPSMRIVLRLN